MVVICHLYVRRRDGSRDRVSHCDAEPRRAKHREVVVGVAHGNCLRDAEAELSRERRQARALVDAGAGELEAGYLAAGDGHVRVGEALEGSVARRHVGEVEIKLGDARRGVECDRVRVLDEVARVEVELLIHADAALRGHLDLASFHGDAEPGGDLEDIVALLVGGVDGTGDDLGGDVHLRQHSVGNEVEDDGATVSNFYWGSEIVATLNSIKTDPKNPQTNKLLTFDLDGDVNAGSELTISVGSKSANYDYVVPNSAIRQDNNGSFVLVITAKNSPLGNRFFAKRVAVEVVASDDMNSAVTGDFAYGDYVITTSSMPVKGGDQVRMAEST